MKVLKKFGSFFKRIGGFLKKHLKLVIILAIILAIVLFVRHKVKVAQEAMLAAANEPVTAEIKKMDLQQSVAVTGTLTANDTKTVTSTIGGSGITGIKVEKVNYHEGDYVEAGTVVVEFDGDDYDRKLVELNAQNNIDNLQSAKDISDYQQKIVDAQKEIDDLQKDINEDQEWLDKNAVYYQDIKDAFENGQKDAYNGETQRYLEQSAIVQERYGFTIESYEAKQKALDKNKDTIKTLQDSIASYEKLIEIGELKQSYAQNYSQVDAKDDIYESMEKTQVSAPISGYIITMNVEAGNNYTQGNTVFTIADTSQFVVEATVNEYDVANIKQELPANIKFEATGDEEFPGTVTFVSVASEGTISGSSTAPVSGYSNTTSTNMSGTATYKIKIKLDENDERLRVGMTAKASVVLDSVSNVLAVPYDCVQTDDNGKTFVTVIEKDGTKKDIDVKKGLESDYYVEISGEGLKEGMTVEAIVTDAPSTDVMDYITDYEEY
ncbi:efflux RND transporter periplasmic adaptor subunit [Pseudobutyrivibrio sp. MD2005]|uniref:efflux RND transporter periplasmic adaptor subunit n=1 Tax=Pseudobutyrivibrio sp. MD2005 TaxID=1410616 RepID=UPI00048534E7|nr:efflux RND transporter periplasmic adaptor subunit [Pseudobutyrivibrio sp. MD2005]